MSSELHEEKRPFAHSAFAWLSMATVMFCYLLGSAVLSLLLDVKPDDPQLAVFQGASQMLFMFVPTLLIMRLSPLGYTGLLRLNTTAIKPRHWILVAVGLVVVQCFSTGWAVVQDALLPQWLTQMLEGMEASRDGMMRTILGNGDVPSIVIATIVVVLVPALSEEILFRGMMQRSLEESLGIKAAIIHTAMFFALVHVSPSDFFPLLCISTILSFLASSSGSLIPGIVLHLLNNSIALTASYVPSLRDTDASQIVALQPAVALVLGSMIVVGLMLRWAWKADRKEELEALSENRND